MEKQREQWGSKIGFILAAAGSAVGLGNIWKYPYLVGENGGAAFILVYLICVLLVGLPIAVAEILIGRTAQQNPVGSFRILTNGNRFWMGIGLLGVLAGFIILSYYNVIAGWSLGYVIQSIGGRFESMIHPQQAGEMFSCLSASTGWCVGYHLLFMALTVGIIYAGVTKGIERASKVLMPLLFLLIVVLVIRGITLPGARPGIRYLLKADFSAITADAVLLALGQAFFSLSLGMGALLTYGSYMSRRENIITSTSWIVGLDTLIALLAGFMIFPALFAMGLEPAQGPALIFNMLPVLFNDIPGGYFFRILFFILLALAALTSTISLLEVITSFLVDEYHFRRHRVAVIMGGLIALFGIPSALSFGAWSEIRIAGKTFFDLSDFIAANILLPVGGLCIALFVGWFWRSGSVKTELLTGTQTLPVWISGLWIFLIRFIAPVLVLIIFLQKIGIL